MAESDEAEVDYCSEHLNVRKEVKIVFQAKREREIFYQSCKVHFIAFKANENELRAAYKRMHMCMLYHPGWIKVQPLSALVSPGQTSRSREKESKVKKAQALFALSKITHKYKRNSEYIVF